MIEAECEISHAANGDIVFTVSRGKNFRALFDLANAENRNLRLIDDRRAEQSSEYARVGDGESAARNFIRFQLLSSRALGEIVRGARRAGDREVVVGLSCRSHQTRTKRE